MSFSPPSTILATRNGAVENEHLISQFRPSRIENEKWSGVGPRVEIPSEPSVHDHK